MSAGHFTRTYEVWRKGSAGVDELGEPIPAPWAKVADVPGRCYPGTKSEERLQAFGMVGRIVWTFACAADTDVKRDDQVRFDGRILTVEAVAVTSRGVRMEALLTELQ